MLVEHITALTGNTVLRETDTILAEAKFYVRELESLSLGRHEIPLPHSALTIRVTIAKEGAIFDLTKGGNVLYMNICNFSRETQGLMYPMVVSMTNQLPSLKDSKLVKPTAEYWMYSMPVAPFLGSPTDNMIAGDAELVIWKALYQNPNITVNRAEKQSPTATRYSFEVGKPFPLPDHPSTGVEYSRIIRNNLSFDLLCYSLTPETDRQTFTKGPLRYGVYQNKGIPFFLLDTGLVQFDASINFLKFEDEIAEEWLNSKANLVTLYLIHAISNTIHGIRAIGIQPQVMNIIRDACEEQEKIYADAASVDQAAEQIASKLLTTDMIKKAAMYRL